MSGSTGKTCPFCMSVIKPGIPVTVCPSCGIPHHTECWMENGGCTTFGCSGRSVIDPEPRPVPPPVIFDDPIEPPTPPDGPGAIGTLGEWLKDKAEALAVWGKIIGAITGFFVGLSAGGIGCFPGALIGFFIGGALGYIVVYALILAVPTGLGALIGAVGGEEGMVLGGAIGFVIGIVVIVAATQAGDR